MFRLRIPPAVLHTLERSLILLFMAATAWLLFATLEQQVARGAEPPVGAASHESPQGCAARRTSPCDADAR